MITSDARSLNNPVIYTLIWVGGSLPAPVNGGRILTCSFDSFYEGKRFYQAA